LWVVGAAALISRGGVLTLLGGGFGRAEVLATLTADFGDVTVLPVYPRADAPPIRILVRAVKGAAAGHRDVTGLVLNDGSGRPAAAAEAVLRGGETLSLAATA
jgi:tRNA1(Val) A37 N6-methylase TrmN6